MFANFFKKKNSSESNSGNARNNAAAVSHEVQQLIDVCERASRGDMEARVLGLDPASGLGRVGNAINKLLDISDAYIR